jgi:NAD(P)-dependent dehydrogenase (short-subunit alcohol dehydrogenase family)
VAVVTGGGSGIGRALATALAAAGARVLVGDIDRVRAQQTAEIIPALGHQAFARGIGVSCLCPTGVDTVLLTRLRESPEPDARLAASAVVTAGEVLDPDAVAELALNAMRENRFLVLPHPKVLDMYRQKAADYDAWIAGMRRYRERLAADG